MKRLLVIEDDNRLRKTLKLEFEDRGYHVQEADSLATIPMDQFDFAIVDLRLQGDSGLVAIDKTRQISPQIKIVVLTGYGSVTTAVEAIKRGAIHYLMKPVDTDIIERALNGEQIPIQHDNHSPPSLAEREHEYIEFVLAQNEGNISKTAKALGLHRQSLQRKLRKKI